MALKNLNQMSMLGGGGTILNSSTNRGSEFLLRQEEEKKKAEEKRRAQIRALDELEAEAGFRNLSTNKNAPVSDDFGTVGQNKPLSAIGQSGLGLSGKVMNTSVLDATKPKGSASGLLDAIKQMENPNGVDIDTSYGTKTSKTRDKMIDNLEKIDAQAKVNSGMSVPDAMTSSKDKYQGFRDVGEKLDIVGEATVGGAARGTGEIIDAIGASGIGYAIDEASKGEFNAGDLFDKEAKAKYKKDYLLSGDTSIDAGQRQLEKLYKRNPEITEGLAGTLFTVAESTSRQLPRLAISALANMVAPGSGAYVTAATMFGTASTGAYKEALENGATDEEAKMYSMLAGGVEAGAEYAFNGILGQGTGYLDDLWKISKKVTEPISRTALKILGSSVGEGFEEMAQSVLTTIAQRITYDPDAKVDFTELAYEGLIGALSAGLMSGANIRGQYRGAKNEIGQIQAEKALGTMSSEDILSAIDSVHETAVELGQEEQFNSALLSVYEKAYGDKASFTERLKNNAKKILDPETEAKANSLGILSTADLSEDAKIAVAKAAAKYGIGTAGTRVTGMQTGTDLGSIGEAERLSKLTGSKVVFFDEAAANGSISNGYEANGIIHVNRQAKNPLAVVLSHELTHTLEGSSSYDDLSYIVFKTLRESGSDIGQMIDDRMTLYAKHNVSLTEEDARREIVADYVSENFMGSEEQIRNIVAQDRPLAVRIREFLDRVLARFGNAGAQERVQGYDRVREIRDAYKKALGERVTESANREKVEMYNDLRYNEDAERSIVYEEENGKSIYRSRKGSSSISGGEIGTGVEEYRESETDVSRQESSSGIDRRNLFGYDSEGRRIDEKIAQQIKNSSVVDDNGSAIAVYHFTPDIQFDTFSEGDIGFHFGTHEQAINRMGARGDDNGRMFRAYLNIKNPYRVRIDLNAWKPTHIGLYLWSENIITDEQFQKIRSLDGDGYNSPGAKYLRSILGEVGIDGFVYSNDYEGVGDSYIALYDNQIVRSEITTIENESDVSKKFSISASGNTETAKQHFGTTRDWAETGYLLTDGTQLDFSGRHWGGDGGYREVDHRDINEALGEDIPGNEAMVSFMAEGNIRISPETGGINISMMPTKEQERALRSFVREYGGEVILDIDNENGVTVSSTEYPAKTSAEKVINDIRAYFETGATPVVSDLGRFRQYSISEVDGETEVRDEDVVIENKAESGIDAAIDESLENSGVSVVKGGAAKYSLTSWSEEDKEKIKTNLVSAGYDEAQASKWIDDVNSVAAAIAKDRSRLDYTADRSGTYMKKNQEYVITLDASLLCAKRRIYQGTYNAIVDKLIDVSPTSDEVLALRRMLSDAGYQTPCGVCYVESRRRFTGKYTDAWLEKQTEGYIPLRSELLNTQRLNALKIEHPDTYKSYVKYMKTRGPNNPKIVENRTDYRGDLRKLSKASIKKILRLGGVRIDSYSDFETPHLIDLMQAVVDMSSMKLTSQAYAKFSDLAWAFGNTGIKINLSLMAEGSGVDANGNLVFSSTEGMDINEAMAARDAYPKDVGTIIVGANDQHILACMADPRIDFIIPFHRSGWKQEQYGILGLNTYSDYSDYQNETNLDGSKIKGGNKYPDDYWDYTKTGKENAETYLDICKKEGRRPKFYNFLVDNGDGSWSLQPDGSTDGYWKTLIDFKMYDNDGVGAPQRPVTPDFNMQEVTRILNEYEGGADTLPVANDIVEKFVGMYNSGELEGYIKSYSPPAEETKKRYSISKADGETEGEDSEFTDYDLELLQAMREDQESWRESEEAKTAAELDYYDGSNIYDNGIGRDGNVVNWDRQREAFDELAGYASDTNTDAQRRVYNDMPRDTMGMIVGEQSKPTLKERVQSVKKGADNAYSAFMRKMVDSGYTVDRISKAVGSPALYHSYNMARASANAGMYMIEGKQTDVAGNVVGDGLNDVLKPVREKGDGYYREFQDYLLHLHNQDRMSRQNLDRVERAKKAFTDFVEAHPELKNYAEYQLDQMAYQNEDAAEYIRLRDAMQREEHIVNKAVFGYDVSAEQSARKAEEHIKKHPEFAEYRDAVYKFIDNLMQYRVDSGLISADQAAYIKSVYPHYIPVYREGDFNQKGANKKNVTVGKTIKRAVGGDQNILPLHAALSKQAMSVVREGSKNRFGGRLVTLHQTDGTNDIVKEHIKEVRESEYDVNENTFDAIKDPTPEFENTFTVRQDGKAYDIIVSPDVFEAVKSLAPSEESNNWIAKSARSLNTLYKSLITGYNPLFFARNAIRDIQDVGINSKDLSGFMKAYPLAWKEITTNGEWYQKYKAAGGLYSSVFDYKTGEKSGSGGVVNNIAKKIEKANSIVEQVPRLAEFISTMQSGDGSYENLLEALYNANEVTTNFGRSGTWGKFLNSNFVPFLNPSIQGFDKNIRNVTETKGGKNWLRLAAKAALLGAAPRLLNELLCGDEEDWDEIKERDKDIYYLFPLGEGEWFKLPKGRTLAVIGTFADAIFDVATEGETDIAGKFETAMSQVGPTNPLVENIARPLIDADLTNESSPGRTWYGTDIESERLQGYEPGQRYDEKTDVLSKWIGDKTGLSPKKINYLLDQYSGVIGDAVLPLLTPTSSDGMFRNAFTMDTVFSNNLSEEFYSLLDELEWAKNAETATGSDKAAYRYMYNKMLDVSDINKQIREAETSDRTQKAKQEEVEILHYMRNAIMREALDQYEAWRNAEDDYYELGTMRGDSEDEASDFAYNEANNEIFGAKYALEAQGSDVYKGAEDAVLDTDLSYEDYYEWYNNVRIKNGKVSDQINAITSSDLSNEVKSQIYYTKYATAKEREVIEMFWQTGTPDAEMYDAVSKLHVASKAAEKRSILTSSKLTDYEQSLYYFTVMASSSQKEKLAEVIGAGITQVEYYDFLMNTLDISGENKKAQILSYIDGTGMTNDEKDLLYLAAGYSENTIDDAPWHSGSFGGSGIFGTSSIFGDSGIFGDSNIFGESSNIFGEKGIFG